MRLSIKHLIGLAAAIGAASLVLAACGGSDDDASDAAGAASGGSGLVSIQNVDGTDVLVDSEGRTLYTAEVESDRIRCVDACESFWEPEAATADEAQSASTDLGMELGVVERPGGERQLTLDGLPLYTFTEEDAGQLEGNGFVDDFQGTHFEWEAAAASGSAAPTDSSGDDFGY